MNKNRKLLFLLILLAALIIAAALIYKALSPGFSKQLSTEFIATETKTPDAAQPTALPPSAAAQPSEANSSAAAQSSGQDESQSPEEEKIAAPDFTVYDAEGNAVKLSDFLGTPVVINFWATWCPYCKIEMPYFEDAFQSLGGDIHFMMIDAVDGMQETQKNGEDYIAKVGFTFPVYYDTNMEAVDAFGISSFPATIFVDKNGDIAAGVSGMIDGATLAKGIALISGQ